MTVDRRRFLAVLGGASLAWPRTVEAFARELGSGGAQDDEAYWALVRGQFLIPEDRIYLNNGTLGPSPAVVVDAVTEGADYEGEAGIMRELLDRLRALATEEAA